MAKKPAAKKADTKSASAKSSSGSSQSVLEAELSKDEKLLWSHRPNAGAFALAHMRAAIMGMPFIMLALLWNGMVMKSLTVPYIGIFTWIFAALGVAYLCVPAVAYMRGKVFVFYAMTNKRLMILSMFPRHEVQSFPIASVNGVFIKNVEYGVGSLIIDAPGANPKNPARPRAGFYGVPYIARVADAFNVLKNPEAARQAVDQQARTQPQAQEAALAPSVPSSAAPAVPSSSRPNSQTVPQETRALAGE